MQWERQLRRGTRSTVVVLGGLVALLIVGAALFAGSLAPSAPDEQNFDLIESAPGARALFGTDRFGRDVLSRVIYGSRISLYVATVSIGVAMGVGGALGLVAGYLGGAWDNVINRVMDVFFSVPGLLAASLSYLGLSAQPPTPSWGNMLNEGRTYLETAPWISVFPGIAIMLSVLAFNLIGDGLRDILDPNVQ